ncbi:DUF1419 domain-containing protein [Mesorhizobium sp. M7A.F.Ca.US.010.02.1.1]|uniref:DUF1419 domain-containing protein n=1 Tax=Mesorhizobium sp. M7A.F.Ca.US.010.02.1.1 TaxID=2496743 RepID=UPI001FE0EEAF|nr:DUF1419 domain-containing protein [Mesorhizobium sp. M7A.F.Ca.US.010.02.1.1]
MTAHPPFSKVLDVVVTREQMFQLFSRHKDTPGIDPLSGTPYSGEWFEIPASEYHFILDLMPPLFMRTGMFGMSEFKAGNVTAYSSRSGSAGASAGFMASAISRIGSRQTRCAPPSSPTRPARAIA